MSTQKLMATHSTVYFSLDHSGGPPTDRHCYSQSHAVSMAEMFIDYISEAERDSLDFYMKLFEASL